MGMLDDRVEKKKTLGIGICSWNNLAIFLKHSCQLFFAATQLVYVCICFIYQSQIVGYIIKLSMMFWLFLPLYPMKYLRWIPSPQYFSRPPYTMVNPRGWNRLKPQTGTIEIQDVSCETGGRHPATSEARRRCRDRPSIRRRGWKAVSQLEL